MAFPEKPLPELLLPPLSEQERGPTAEEQILEDARMRGRGTVDENGAFNADLRGLRLTLKDQGEGPDSTQRTFVVRDISTRKEPIAQTRKVGLPRFNLDRPGFSISEKGRFFGSGWKSFGRPTETRITHSVGWPKLRIRDGIFTPRKGLFDLDPPVSFGRDQELIGERDVTYARLEVYDKNGNLTDTTSKNLDYLYAEAGEHGISNIEWEDDEKASPNGELHINLNNKDPIFKQVTRGLEAEGITNWTGLTWAKVEAPSPQFDFHQEELESARAVPMTQEIVSDTAVYGPSHDGQSMRWSRMFVVRTTRHGEDGVDRTEEVHMRDYELWRYLDFKKDEDGHLEASDGLIFTNMRMPVNSESLRKNAAFVIPEDIRNLYGKDYEAASLQETLGRLMLREEVEQPSDAAIENLEERVRKAKKGRKKNPYNNELRSVLEEAGPDYFNRLVNFLWESTKEPLQRDEQRLGLPETLDDTWIVESLIERSAELRKHNVRDPLLHVLQTPHLLRSLVDQRVGELFGIETVRSELATVPDGIDEKGQQKAKQEVHHLFNDAMFDAVLLLNKGSRAEAIDPYGAVIGSYSQGNSFRPWRNKIWTPIEERARELFKPIAEHKHIDHRILEEFGRMLRRTIGE